MITDSEVHKKLIEYHKMLLEDRKRGYPYSFEHWLAARIAQLDQELDLERKLNRELHETVARLTDQLHPNIEGSE